MNLPHLKTDLRWMMDRLREKARRKVPDSDVEDLVQEVMVVLVERMRDSRVDAIQAYAEGILRHMIYDYYQKRRERLSSVEDQNLESIEPSPEQRVSWESQLQSIDVVARENPVDLALVRDHFVSGEPLHQVASRLGVSPGVVNGRLFRFRQKLRDRVGQSVALAVAFLSSLWSRKSDAAAPSSSALASSSLLPNLAVFSLLALTAWTSLSLLPDAPGSSSPLVRTLSSPRFAASASLLSLPPAHLAAHADLFRPSLSSLAFPRPASENLPPSPSLPSLPSSSWVVSPSNVQPSSGLLLPRLTIPSRIAPSFVGLPSSALAPAPLLLPLQIQTPPSFGSSAAPLSSAPSPSSLSSPLGHASAILPKPSSGSPSSSLGQETPRSNPTPPAPSAQEPQSTKPTKPTHPTKPTKPADPTPPADPTKPTNPTHPTHPTNPTHPTSPSAILDPSRRGGLLPQASQGSLAKADLERLARVDDLRSFCFRQDGAIYDCNQTSMADIIGRATSSFTCGEIPLCHDLLATTLTEGPAFLVLSDGFLVIAGERRYRISKDSGLSWTDPSDVPGALTLLQQAQIVVNQKGEIWRNAFSSWKKVRSPEGKLPNLRVSVTQGNLRFEDEDSLLFGLSWQDAQARASLPSLAASPKASPRPALPLSKEALSPQARPLPLQEERPIDRLGSPLQSNRDLQLR